MSEQSKKNKIASQMLMIVVILILVVLSSVNVKTIILDGFGKIVIFKVITMVFLVASIALNLISAFLYVAVMSSQIESTGKFKAANVLFLIGLCVSVVLLLMNQCA